MSSNRLIFLYNILVRKLPSLRLDECSGSFDTGKERVNGVSLLPSVCALCVCVQVKWSVGFAGCHATCLLHRDATSRHPAARPQYVNDAASLRTATLINSTNNSLHSYSYIYTLTSYRFHFPQCSQALALHLTTHAQWRIAWGKKNCCVLCVESHIVMLWTFRFCFKRICYSKVVKSVISWNH